MKLTRRALLTQLSAAGAATAAPWSLLLANAPTRAAPNLRPVVDETSGLPPLELPEGFRYRSIAWTGDAMRDGTLAPDRPDGMAVVQSRGHELTLVRNHERAGSAGAFGAPEFAYDPVSTGGTTSLTFDTAKESASRAWPSLGGTLINCAGGPTPWGTWLSCEECVFDAGDTLANPNYPIDRITRPHGFVFEVGAGEQQAAQRLTDMGQFVHEAVAIEPSTGVAYLTEDNRPAGLYRYLPAKPGRLAAGGNLQQCKVLGQPDLRRANTQGQRFDVSWVDIEAPTRGKDADGGRHGVFDQGLAQGATKFTRLEGCWVAGPGQIVFTATDGGTAELGQVWLLDTVEQTLELLFASPSRTVLDNPDNITANPHGGYLLCEDGKNPQQRLQWLRADGSLFPFAANAAVFDKGPNGISGNFQSSEWAGACFSPDGQWLFVNIQTPGITFAITGPWASLS